MMMDYEGFWRGFVLLFIAMPFVVGAGAGTIWAWRNGRRGTHLIASAIVGGVGLCLCVFAGAVLFFRA
jgi:biotin transporter BioY